MSSFLMSSILPGRARYNGAGRDEGFKEIWGTRAYSLDSHVASLYTDSSCVRLGAFPVISFYFGSFSLGEVIV